MERDSSHEWRYHPDMRGAARERPVTAARSAPSEASGALALLASRRFGPLFATQFLSAFNDNAVRNALVLMIAYSGDIDALSAQILIPLAGGIFMLPFFLCSATAGQLADARDKAWLIRWIKLLEIPVMLVAAAGVLAGSTTVLLALLFAMGIQAAFFGPLKYAILPDLLARDELLLGNALVEAGTFLAILLGTIAGVLIATRHGAAAVAALIVIVALAAWTASLAIRQTGAAAPDAGTALESRRGDRADRPASRRRCRAVSLDPRHLVVLARRRHLPVAISGLCPLYARRRRGRRDPVPDRLFGRDRVRLAALQSAPRRQGQRPDRALGRTRHRAVLDRFVARQPDPDRRRDARRSRRVSRRPGSLAYPSRPLRDRRVRRRLCRAALRAAADGERASSAAPRRSRQTT